MAKKVERSRKKKCSEKVMERRKKNPVTPAPNKARNPFELKFNKQKHPVVGRNPGKASVVRVGKPGFSKQKALDRRKDTLLGEFRKFSKTNRLQDRRVAEETGDISQEEKSTRRFTLERQRLFKKRGVFRLDDDEDEKVEENLTHGGQNLADIELIDEPVTNEENKIELDDYDMADINFGGGGASADFTGGQKSRKELIADLISRSKKLKYERQAQKSKKEDLTERLDEEWKELVKGNLLRKLRGAKTVSSQQPPESSSPTKKEASHPKQDYDEIFAALRHEGKSAKATDRLETPEEIARKERDRLEMLERQRKERMRLLTCSTTAESSHVSPDDDLEGNLKTPRQRGELHYTKEGKLVVLGEQSKLENEKGSTDASSDNDLSELTEENFSDVDEIDGQIDPKPQGRSDVGFKSDTGIPFVFDMPVGFAELRDLLRGYGPEGQGLILERLVKCHHPSLKQGNKDRLRRLFVYLLRYFDSEPGPAGSLGLLTSTASGLFALAQTFPDYAGQAVLKLLNRHRQLWLSKEKYFPQLRTLLLIRLVPHLFSASDFRHPVATPALSLAMEILRKVRFRSVSDVAKGLCLCSITMEYVAQSKRYLPEVLSFLSGVLCLARGNSGDLRPTCGNVPCKLPRSEMLVISEGLAEVDKLDLRSVFGSCESALDGEAAKAACLSACVTLASSLARLYSDVTCFRQIFAPIAEGLRGLPIERYNESLQKSVEGSVARIEKLMAGSEGRLAKLRVGKRARKAAEFKFLEPRMEAGFNPEKKKKGAKAESKRLSQQVRKETRGAMRELRRDSQFLAREKLKERMGADVERTRKTKDILRALRGQESEVGHMKKRKM